MCFDFLFNKSYAWSQSFPPEDVSQSTLSSPFPLTQELSVCSGNLESNRALVGVLRRADLTLMSLPLQLCAEVNSPSGRMVSTIQVVADTCLIRPFPTCPCSHREIARLFEAPSTHFCSDPTAGSRLSPQSRTQAPLILWPHTSTWRLACINMVDCKTSLEAQLCMLFIKL